MSDADLRELERRWRETGSVEDEAAWLRARVQAGELEQSRLELAAYSGSAGALLALGPQAPALLDNSLHFTFGLRDYGQGACLRAAWLALDSHLKHVRDQTGEERGRIHAFKVERHGALLGGRLERVEAALVSGQVAADIETGSPAGFAMHVVRDAVQRVLPISSERLLAEFRTGLIPWALGYGDPVRERVEARQRAEAAGE